MSGTTQKLQLTQAPQDVDLVLTENDVALLLSALNALPVAGIESCATVAELGRRLREAKPK